MNIVIEFLNRGKFDFNTLWIITKSIYLFDIYRFIINNNFFFEKVFCMSVIYKIILGFIDNVVLIYKEKKMSVSLLVVIQNSACHQKRFSCSCCHVKHQVCWLVWIFSFFD